jgi:hypothetical protein
LLVGLAGLIWNPRFQQYHCTTVGLITATARQQTLQSHGANLNGFLKVNNMNDKTAEMHKNNALLTIRLFADDEEFVRQLFATLHVSSEDQAIRQIALEAYLQIDETTTLPDLPALERK